MSYGSYELDSVALATTFAHYVDARKLPVNLFDRPDHISLRYPDIKDFSRTVGEVRKASDQLVFSEEDERFVITAKLSGILGVSNLGKVKWLQIAAR